MRIAHKSSCVTSVHIAAAEIIESTAILGHNGKARAEVGWGN